LDFTLHETSEDALRVVLSGTINEDSGLDLQRLVGLVEERNRPSLVFDFSAVHSVNSLGVRAWIQFLRQVEGAGAKVFFEACSPEVVMQFNIIPNFLGQATVLSFFANYVCESCALVTKPLIRRDELKHSVIPARPVCPSCSAVMESRQIEEEYFGFLKKSN
jgi:anti-anti-sigma regulatory factor